MQDRFVPVAYGVDDITLGFDMTGSGSVARLNDLPGNATRRGKMLGSRTSWGQWAHLLGRSASFWKSDTCRLYVQAKLAPPNELCAPRNVAREIDALTERMAVVGLMSWEPPWVTRLDVAVDARCNPADGKLLLDGLEAARLPRGWRTTSTGSPRSTVYFRSRVSDHVRARAYCRNLKMREGEPYGLIRLEAEERYAPKDLMLEAASAPAFLGWLWESRFGGLASEVVRLGREVQAIEIGARMREGELRYAEAERLHLFLELERLGIASGCYPKSIYAARRREARKLGFAANDYGSDPVVVELVDLLRPYANAVQVGLAA